MFGLFFESMQEGGWDYSSDPATINGKHRHSRHEPPPGTIGYDPPPSCKRVGPYAAWIRAPKPDREPAMQARVDERPLGTFTSAEARCLRALRGSRVGL